MMVVQAWNLSFFNHVYGFFPLQINVIIQQLIGIIYSYQYINTRV